MVAALEAVELAGLRHVEADGGACHLGSVGHFGFNGAGGRFVGNAIVEVQYGVVACDVIALIIADGVLAHLAADFANHCGDAINLCLQVKAGLSKFSQGIGVVGQVRNGGDAHAVTAVLVVPACYSTTGIAITRRDVQIVATVELDDEVFVCRRGLDGHIVGGRVVDLGLAVGIGDELVLADAVQVVLVGHLHESKLLGRTVGVDGSAGVGCIAGGWMA